MGPSHRPKRPPAPPASRHQPTNPPTHRHLQDIAGGLGLNSVRCVAKKYSRSSVEHLRRNGGVGDEVYFRDVHMQFVANAWAGEFNARGPPKPVEMIPAVVIEIEHPGTFAKTYFGVERYIGEEFEKYNSNHFTPQLLLSTRTRETPDAFSHFTFEASGRQVMVADIQGCGDVYTDPQILTPTDEQFEFGVGNTAMDGIKLWFASHQCRGVCRGLNLEHPYPKELDEGLQHTRRMSHLKTLYSREGDGTKGLHTMSTSVQAAGTGSPIETG